MIRFSNMIRLVTAASFLTLAIGASAAMAAPNDAVRLATTETVSSAAPEKVGLPASAEPVSACARKVKVVYAGYGEADRAGCGTSTTAAR